MKREKGNFPLGKVSFIKKQNIYSPSIFPSFLKIRNPESIDEFFVCSNAKIHLLIGEERS